MLQVRQRGRAWAKPLGRFGPASGVGANFNFAGSSAAGPQRAVSGHKARRAKPAMPDRPAVPSRPPAARRRTAGPRHRARPPRRRSARGRCRALWVSPACRGSAKGRGIRSERNDALVGSAIVKQMAQSRICDKGPGITPERVMRGTRNKNLSDRLSYRGGRHADIKQIVGHRLLFGGRVRCWTHGFEQTITASWPKSVSTPL